LESVEDIANIRQRQELLDWFDLVENLNKVGGSQQRLVIVKALLWKGDVDGAIEQFKDWQHERVDNFIAYLNSSSSSHRQLQLLSSRRHFNWFGHN
jgi:hypothetical protein